MTGHIKTFLRPEAGLKSFISRHSNKVGGGLATSVGTLIMCGGLFTANRFIENRVAAAQALLKSHTQGADALAAKVDFLIDAAAKGIWPQFALALSALFVFALIVPVMLGVWISTAAANPPSSFLLISKKAEERKTTLLKKRQRKWLKLIASILVAIVTGVIANIIFALQFR